MVAYISGTIIIVLFLVVLIYHTFTEICSKTKFNVWKKLRQKRLDPIEDGVSLLNYQQTEDNLSHVFQPTVSWVAAPQCEQTFTGPVEGRKNESEINN